VSLKNSFFPVSPVTVSSSAILSGLFLAQTPNCQLLPLILLNKILISLVMLTIGLCYLADRRGPVRVVPRITKQRRRYLRSYADILLIVCFLILGICRTHQEKTAWSQLSSEFSLPGGAMWISGHFDGQRLKVEQVRAVGETEIRTLHRGPPLWLRGDPLSSELNSYSRGRLEGFIEVTPGRSARSEGGFNEIQYLRGKQCVAWARIKYVELSALSDGNTWRWLTFTPSLRQQLANHIKNRLPGAGGRFAASFLLGRNATKPGERQFAESFHTCGLGHILAVSGLHIGLMASLVAIFVHLLPVSTRMRWLMIAGGLFCYAALVGWGTSVTRATSAAAGWAILSALGRRLRGPRLLLIITAVVLWIDPFSWRSAGWQLSYLISAVLLGLFTGQVRSRPLYMLLAAQATAWPLVLANFGGASPLSLIANLLLLPVAGFLLPMLVVALLCDLLPGFPAAPGWLPVELLLELFLSATEVLAMGCRKFWVGPLFSPAVGFAAAIGCLVCANLSALRPGLRCALIFCLIPGVTLIAMVTPPRYEIAMLDVGQGEAWLIFWPHETWVIDTGPPPGEADRPKEVIARALRAGGRTRIDRLFLTHDDSDHTGGLEALLRHRLPVTTVYHPAGWEVSAATLDRLDRLDSNRIVLTAGDTLRTSCGFAAVLHPTGMESELTDKNSGALVLSIRYKSLQLLLCSDVPSAVQASWHLKQSNNRWHLITAAHHGSASATSETLLTQTNPLAVLCSVGRGNRFGHPSRQVISRVQAARAELFRTDCDGTVMVRQRGDNWEVESRRSSRRISIIVK
jgi:competence protein ComEC